MAILHVRAVPENLYAQAKQLAEAQGMTLSAFVVSLMERAAQEENVRLRHAKAMQSVKRNLRQRVTKSSSMTPAFLVQSARAERETELFSSLS